MMKNGCDLALVMPVYNESELIAQVVRSWVQELRKFHINFRIDVHNDGSRDQTADILNQLALELPELKVYHWKNSGHGPTILRGYRMACDATWIFQADSDGEIAPSYFAELWDKRDQYDFLLGLRKPYLVSLGRRFISRFAWFLGKIFYGVKVWDTNIPFRLYRSEKFAPLFNAIPEDSFTPNIVLSGASALLDLRSYEKRVVFSFRAAGESTIVRWKLIKAIVKAFGQLVTYRFLICWTRLKPAATSYQKDTSHSPKIP